MKPSDLLSITAAAREINCGRSTLYRAIDDGRITGVEVGGRRMIVRDDAWKEFEPNFVGRRAQMSEQVD
jgi:excisionase family DNA binding protein